MATNHTLIPDIDIWSTSGMIIPAVMTLICFICTAISLTVSGFICLRDREAQDETDNRSKHHAEQEFVSKVLGLFYKIRTSNIFRIKEIMQDLNDEKPVWIGSKREIVTSLEYYGIFLTESQKSKLMTRDEVFEIDCESLFYFELERFSKAQAIYGSNVLNYYECIQQDGAAFPREFYPDIKTIFHIDIIYNVFTEMQIITELFVLLATGIDLEIISVHSIPPQFRHSKIGDELSKIKDFLYNYYKRVFPNERSSANVMRKLPQLPIVYEKILSDATPETIETIVEVEEEEEFYELPAKTDFGSRSTIDSLDEQPLLRIPPSPSRPTTLRPPTSPSPSIRSTSSNIQGPSKARRLSGSLGKQKVKMVRVYQRLSDRVRQRPYSQEDDRTSLVDPEEIPRDPKGKRPSVAIIRESQDEEEESFKPKVKFDETPSSTPRELQKRIVKKSIKKRVPVIRNLEETQEVVLEKMKHRYKAPVKRENSDRRRGMLARRVTIEHNAFTYMVARVIAFLHEKGHLKDEELNGEMFVSIDRNFIV